MSYNTFYNCKIFVIVGKNVVKKVSLLIIVDLIGSVK